MPKNAILKTTVTQPDDQKTPKNKSATHRASQTNLFRPKTDISMHKNAILKTTVVTQPDDQETPKNKSATHRASCPETRVQKLP